MTGKGVGALLSLVYIALATRSLGVERFGQFMLIFSTAQAIAAFVSFQSWQTVVRYGMAPLRDRDRAALGRVVSFCAELDLVGAIVGCGIAAAAVAIMRAQFGWSPVLAREALLFCLVLLLSVRSTAVGVLRLHDRFGTGAVADAMTPIVRFLGALAVVLMGASVQGFLLAWGLAEVATAAAYWWLALRASGGIAWHWPALAGAGREHPGLWQFAFLTNVNTTLESISKQLMVVVVGLVAGPAAAGAYRLAFQLSQSLARLSDMFSRGIFPEFTRAHAEDRTHLALLFRQSTRLTVTVGGAICLLAPLLGRPILHLVGGRHYLGAYPLILLLSLSAALDLMGTGFEPVLLGTGRARTASRIRVATVGVLIVTAVLLMPRWGAVGAAGATLASSAIALILFGRAAWLVVNRPASPAGASPALNGPDQTSRTSQ